MVGPVGGGALERGPLGRLDGPEGRPFAIEPVGYKAVDSLRLEKGYRSWKADLTTEYTPAMASLDRFVRLDKVQHSLVHQRGDVTTVVTGTAGFSDLAVLAASLTPTA